MNTETKKGDKEMIRKREILETKTETKYGKSQLLRLQEGNKVLWAITTAFGANRYNTLKQARRVWNTIVDSRK